MQAIILARTRVKQERGGFDCNVVEVPWTCKPGCPSMGALKPVEPRGKRGRYPDHAGDPSRLGCELSPGALGDLWRLTGPIHSGAPGPISPWPRPGELNGVPRGVGSGCALRAPVSAAPS
mmetsp:Transcript_74421/g.197539  ORF Transcript_74421/g.197539 Transcript_74421/m.197539 type:complete len:120 (+) Transcript_74421:1171-1530(+)